MARKSTGKRLRFVIFERDGFTCRYCGARPPGAALVTDHVYPAALGGPTIEGNLVTACTPCNQGKGAHMLSVRPLPISAAQIDEVLDMRDLILRGHHPEGVAETYQVAPEIAQQIAEDIRGRPPLPSLDDQEWPE